MNYGQHKKLVFITRQICLRLNITLKLILIVISISTWVSTTHQVILLLWSGDFNVIKGLLKATGKIAARNINEPNTNMQIKAEINTVAYSSFEHFRIFKGEKRAGKINSKSQISVESFPAKYPPKYFVISRQMWRDRRSVLPRSFLPLF